MQKAWYAFVKVWVKLAIKLFYRRIEIRGLDEFPESGPVLLAPNHQNAFMDALIPAVFSPRNIHFLVRADVFSSRMARFFFGSLNMMPVYRQRDGREALAKNEDVFEKCFEILRRGEVLLLFPEATHLGERRLRPLSKGFTRIAFGALEGREDLSLKIVPLGLNYSNYHQSQARLLLNFGAPISANAYLDEYSENPQKAMFHLREDVSNHLQKEIIHLEEEHSQEAFEIELERILPFYLDRTGGYLQSVGHHDFYKGREKAIRKLPEDHPHFRRIVIYEKAMKRLRFRAPIFFIARKDPGYWVVQNLFLLLFLPLFFLSWIAHAPSYLIIRGILSRYVSDLQFYSSIKLVGMLVLFPFFAAIIALLVGFWLDRPLLAVLIGLVFFPVSVFVIRELRLPYRYCITMWRILILRWRKRDLYKYLKRIEEETIEMYNRQKP